MKKRRIMIAAFLLASCLVIGFGFAALATQMEITGTAETAKDDNLLDDAVFFSKAEALDNEGTTDIKEDEVNTAHIVEGTDGDGVYFVVNSLKKKGDMATFSFTITSRSTYALDLSLSISNTTEKVLDQYVFDESMYDLTTTWDEGGPTIDAMTDGEAKTKVLTVTVMLNKNPDNNVVGDFFIRVNAVTQANSNPATPPSNNQQGEQT